MPKSETAADRKAAKERLELRKLRAEAKLAELKVKETEDRIDADAADDESARHYRFFETVSKGTVEYAIEHLQRISRRYPEEDITLSVCSPGGDVFAGLALYDFIQELRAKGHYVTVEAKGFAASMGGIILQAGDKRIMSKECHLLIHEVASLGMGKVSELLDEAAFCKKLWEQLAGILAERSTMSAKAIMRKADRRDWWLNAEESLKLGFCDAVQ